MTEEEWKWQRERWKEEGKFYIMIREEKRGSSYEARKEEEKE